MDSKATSRLSAFLTAVVVILSACDVLVVCTSPWWLKALFQSDLEEIKLMLGYNRAVADVIYPLMLAFFIVSGLLCLGIFAAAYRILKRIRNDNPFCIENAVSLRNAAICAFALFAVFLLKMLFSPSILTLVCACIFLLFGLFVMVISQLVRTAAKIKEENDLTI